MFLAPVGNALLPATDRFFLEVDFLSSTHPSIVGMCAVAIKTRNLKHVQLVGPVSPPPPFFRNQTSIAILRYFKKLFPHSFRSFFVFFSLFLPAFVLQHRFILAPGLQGLEDSPPLFSPSPESLPQNHFYCFFSVAICFLAPPLGAPRYSLLLGT